MSARLGRVRWPLIAILVIGAVWTITFVLQCVQYFIQPDELEYVKQSRLIAQELHPLLPSDRYFNSWSQLQPLLLAPVWAIRDTNLAHQLMGIVNAIIMVSAAIPAYLLTLRVVPSRRAAYLVATLTIFIPWIAASATMMTEVAAYPAFVWAVFAVQHAVARPGLRGDLIGLAGVLLAYLARPQLAVLGAALVGGVLAQELRYLSDGDALTPRRERLVTGLRAALWRHRLLLGVIAVGLVGYVVVQPDLFGGYSREGVTTGALDAPGLWQFSRELAAYVAVGVAVLPLAMAIGWALMTFWRPLNREQHAFAVIATIAILAMTVAVGSFTARYTPQGINSRYLFYIVPLLLIGMVALVADRRPATLPLAIGGLIAGWLVFGAALAQSGPSLVSPDQTFHTVLIGRTGQLGRGLGLPDLSFPRLLGVGVVVLALLLAWLRRTRWRAAVSVAAVAAVALWCIGESAYSLNKIAQTQAGVSQEFIDGRDWIDDVMPDGESAQMIVSTFGDPASSYGVWWDTAFWNSSVDRAMTLASMPDLQQPFPQAFQVLPDGSFAGYAGSIPGTPVSIAGPGLGSGPWFVRATTDRSFGFRDAQVAAERFGVELVHTPSPPMAAWAFYGTFDDTGKIAQSAPPAELYVYPRDPEADSVPVELAVTTLPGQTQSQRFRVGDRMYRVAPEETKVVQATARRDDDGVVRLLVEAPGPAPQVPRGIQVVGVTVP